MNYRHLDKQNFGLRFLQDSLVVIPRGTLQVEASCKTAILWRLYYLIFIFVFKNLESKSNLIYCKLIFSCKILLDSSEE